MPHSDFELYYLVIAALIGLTIGSFINVVIYRFQLGESIVSPPSSCPHCKTHLRLWDLIPVFSYLFLRGRCRYCRAGISIRYPLVELTTGLVFALSVHHFGLSVLLPKYLLIFCILLIVSGIDLDEKRIPNIFVLILLAWAALWQIVYPEITHISAVTGLLVGGGSFLLIALFSRGGMGGGDVKLMAALGLAAGWPNVILLFLLAFISGAAVGAALMLFKKKTGKSALPFGPFIAFSFLITALWGSAIWQWYWSLL